VFYEGPFAIGDFYSHLPPSALPYDISNREWILSSSGPDLVFGAGLGQGGEIYDATNGTISPGNIYRLGP
jgi:hypothetical protein